MISYRKKRDISCSPLPHNVVNELDETVLATYSIVRAALNSLEIDGDCVGKFMCEGGKELRKRGEGGRMLLEMGGELLGSKRYHGLTEGFEGVDCKTRYRDCVSFPKHYRLPGVSEGGSYTEPENILHMVKNAVELKFKKRK